MREPFRHCDFCAVADHLADDVGTVREIVFRQLGHFERAGWLRLSRERIEVLDAPALQAGAAGAAQA